MKGAFQVSVVKRYHIVQVGIMFFDVDDVYKLFGVILQIDEDNSRLGNVCLLQQVEIVVVGLQRKDLFKGVILTNDIDHSPVFGYHGHLAAGCNQVGNHRLGKIVPPHDNHVITKPGTIKAHFLLLFQCAHKVCNLTNDKTVNTQRGKQEDKPNHSPPIRNGCNIAITHGGKRSHDKPHSILKGIHTRARRAPLEIQHDKHQYTVGNGYYGKRKAEGLVVGALHVGFGNLKAMEFLLGLKEQAVRAYRLRKPAAPPPPLPDHGCGPRCCKYRL